MFKDRQSGLLILMTGFILICFLSMFHQDGNLLERSDLVRFHVVANSDSSGDQALKLKVKDQVMEELSPVLGSMETAEESRAWLQENSDAVNDIAERVIKEEGYDYASRSELGMRWIPEKTYGSIVMPAGNYEAFTIEIGAGEGENWWCVMFPPICIIGDDPEFDRKTEERFRGTKYEGLMESCIDGSPYVLKFKTLEIGEKLLGNAKK